MKSTRRTVRHLPSPLAQACLLESLEVRQFLSTTFPNILPLGDSITESATGHASYRYWLWNSLADAGHTVDFVGSTLPAGVAGGPPLYAGFDPHHDGHSGWRADQLQVGLASAGWKDFALQPQNTPDIALVHIGTNDIQQGQSNAITRNETSGIIDALRAVNPNVTVLLAQIIPNTSSDVAPLNVMLSALATLKNTAQSRVILVDQATGFDAATDTYDGIHPNEAGEKKMAAKWLAALTPLLPAPTAPPAGTYLDTPAVTLTSATTAFGPVEYEMSNGESGTHDGQLLSMRGQTFMRGFGVHGPSELVFSLSGGTYSRFRATVGVDDEVNPNGSAVFQVFVNDETTARFTSPLVNGLSAPLPIDVDITGATSLRLVVTDGGDGTDFDHGDWAMARVITPATQPPPTDPPTDPEPPQPPPPEEDVAPSAPRRLIAQYHGHKIDLCWKDTSNNESGFRVFRKTGLLGNWQRIAELPANSRGYRDISISRGTLYSYRVVAYNDEGSSTRSNTAFEIVPPKKGKKDKPKNDNQGQNNQPQKPVQKLLEVVAKALKKVFGRR